MSSISPQAQSLVYLDVPRALQQVGDEDALRGMLPMLQEMLERDLPLIQQRLAEGDVRGTHPILHSLKGCLPIFCTPSLCEHVAQVEQMSKTGVGPEVNEAFAMLNPKLKQLQQEVALFLSQP